MNLTMFPRMLSSHEEGWAWLMRIHPTVTRMYLLYVLPMCLVPVTMLLYAAGTYGGRMMLGNVTMREGWILAAVFFFAEMIMVPVMGAVIQRIGDMVDARPAYHDAFAFAAVVPTPLWLSSLALLVPSLTFNALATAVALYLCGLLIFEGTYRVFRLEDQGKSLLLTGSIIAAGLVAWVALMGLAFVSWGWAIS